MDRLCLQRLLLFSEAMKIERQGKSIFPWPVGDLSQKGDWSCFRNDFIDGKPGVISTSLFTPMPHKVCKLMDRHIAFTMEKTLVISNFLSPLMLLDF